MPTKKILVALLIIVVAIGGFVAGLILLRQRQDLEDEAAVEGGQATVSIVPETGNYNVGDTIDIRVYFNPENIAISTVGVRLAYPFSGATPEVTVSSININSSFLSAADWTCPSPTEPKLEGGNVVIEISCANQGAFGFTANADTLLADISLTVERVPAENPLVVRFDAAESIITRHLDNEDVLLIPRGTGTYTILGAGVQVTQTPTPIGLATGTVTLAPTTSLTATPTNTPTPTVTGVTTGTTTPTTSETLPDAGVSFPTLMGISTGVLILFAALVLAL